MSNQANENGIVITGVGWVTPLARGGVAEVLAAAGRGPLGDPGESGFHAIPAEWLGEHGGLAKELTLDKSAWVTALAVEAASQQAGVIWPVEDPTRVGFALGNALAGQLGMIQFAEEVRKQSPRFVSPLHFPQTVGNYVSGALARAYGICGATVTLAGGQASGLNAITEARVLLEQNTVDIALAGGIETLSRELVSGLPESAAPYSEGACLVILERASSAAARGVTVLAWLEEAAGDEADVSAAAGTPQAGDVWIEGWIGHSLGAAGMAAIAAGIGAAHGQEVPVWDGGSVVAKRLEVGSADRAGVQVRVQDGDEGPVSLHLAVPRA